METPESLVAQNVADLRERRRYTVRALSAVLEQLGRKILPSGITKIESRNRSVDVGDLVALALALGVNPNRLLLPPTAGREPVALAPEITVTASEAWTWADGEGPLLPARLPDVVDPLDDFMRHARPREAGPVERHTAYRAAADVAARIENLLNIAYDVTPRDADEQQRRAAEAADSLRRALRRLYAEADDLIEGGDEGWPSMTSGT